MDASFFNSLGDHMVITQTYAQAIFQMPFKVGSCLDEVRVLLLVFSPGEKTVDERPSHET